MSNVQKFLANEGGIHKRRLDIRPIPSATFPNSISKSSRLGNGPAPHIRPVTLYLNRDDL